MGVAASSSSSSSSKKYEVFLSFRGEDTCRSFTSHLHTALCLKSIETFIDYRLPKGDDISESLVQAIQDSTMSVIVFSKNYASSKWCLNELIEILRCKEEQGQLVVPIFYQVDPSHVRKQDGAYKEAFAQHLKKNPDKVDEWKKALFETASLAGWDSCNCRDETELIQNIVSDIIIKLNHGCSSTLANIFGIDNNCDAIELLLEEFSTVGIWGMGGIGKTTMAKVLFAKFRSQFDSCCFLENFREESEKHGLVYIRDKLVKELSNDRSLEELGRRKVLIVLDDVSDTSQLDYFENEAPCFGPGSKVIITSRDKHVLEGRVEGIHKAKALCPDNSLELFNLKAFREGGYKSKYKELVKRALVYAQGVPLALTMLGSLLHSKTIEEWESTLSKLGRRTHPNIQAVLKISYDALDDEQREVFLDIACFLKGKSEGCVLAMLESCGFHAKISLRTLMDKALITIHNNFVLMHDLIQSMAFEIVRQECLTNPERCRQLVDPDVICDVLKHNQGSDAIQGISLNLSKVRDLQLSADTFSKMTNLRFHKFYSSWGQRSCIVKLPSRLDSFPNLLCYLRWDNFRSKSLPLSFCAEKLVELYLPNSHLKKLWNGEQNLVNLRKISLHGSKYLMELPDFSRAQNLEWLSLMGCERLSHLDPSVLSLPMLSTVALTFCRSLKSVKTEVESKSISDISFIECRGLKEFSFSSNKMGRLNLADAPIETLEFPFGHMEKFKEFFLNCSKLKYLPIDDMICCMRSLVKLHLENCSGIIDRSKLHSLFDSLLSLQSLYLDRAWKLTELPHNIKHLSRLKSLILRSCWSLQSLPELPPPIEELEAFNCPSLYSLDLRGSYIESLHDSIKHLLNQEHINLSNCTRLPSLPKLPFFIETVDADGCISLEIVPALATTSHLRSLLLQNCLKLENHNMESACFPLKLAIYTRRKCEICYPGRKVPEWFKSNQGIDTSNNISIELPSITTDLIGFVLCSVVSHHTYGELQCQLYYNGKKHTLSEFEQRLSILNSVHVYLWCVSDMFINFGKTMDDQNTNYKPNLLFEFSASKSVIEACGVCPIYASKYPEFIQQMELEANFPQQEKLKVSMGKKRN